MQDETGEGFAETAIGFFPKVGKKCFVRVKKLAIAIHYGYCVLYQFDKDVDGIFIRNGYRHKRRCLLICYKS
jgi:hypothetical protein